MENKAVIAGASGLIGSELLNILIGSPHYSSILILVRQEIDIKDSRVQQLVIDFDKLNEYRAVIEGDVLFCCLGTTRSKTPDMDTYRKIEHDYVLQLAQIGIANNVKQLHYVSSMGADSASSNYYLKFKGETERDLTASGLKQLVIYQPSLLTGERKENRFAEKTLTFMMRMINPLLFGRFKNYRSIAAATVAAAMYKQSLTNREGVFIYPSEQIKQLT